MSTFDSQLTMSKASLLLIDVQVMMFKALPSSLYSSALFGLLQQNDFHAGGSLAVPGADADSLRIAEMIE